MAWQIELSGLARKNLDELDPQHARRILAFLHGRVAHLDDPRSTFVPWGFFASAWALKAQPLRVHASRPRRQSSQTTTLVRPAHCSKAAPASRLKCIRCCNAA